MDFKYKSAAELSAMTPEEQEKYVTSKREYEENKQSEAVKTQVAEQVKVIGDALKAELKTANDALTSQAAIIEEQGKSLASLKTVTEANNKMDIMEAFKAAYDEVPKDGEFSIKGQDKIKIDVEKVTISSDVLSSTLVNAAQFPTAGATQAIDSGYVLRASQNIGIARYRKPYSPIMEVVDVRPLQEANLYILNESFTGDAAITPECTLKPIVKVTYAGQQAEALAVAAEWATTTQLRRFYPTIANAIQSKIAELVMDKTPASVLAAVVAAGTAFTPNASLVVNEDPNDYDAIGAVIAQLQTLGYVPNAVVLSPAAWYRMIHSKASDGHYSVWNGNAISLVGEIGISYQGRIIRWVIDPTIAADRFLVGDFIQGVKVGLDGELLYFETDGRTDATAAGASGLSRNIRTHVVERFVATLIPNATRTAIVSDTFANVKTLITAA